jgi:hypothetical protein
MASPRILILIPELKEIEPDDNLGDDLDRQGTAAPL